MLYYLNLISTFLIFTVAFQDMQNTKPANMGGETLAWL